MKIIQAQFLEEGQVFCVGGNTYVAIGFNFADDGDDELVEINTLDKIVVLNPDQEILILGSVEL